MVTTWLDDYSAVSSTVASLRVRVPLATGRSPVMIPRLAALQAMVRHPGMGPSLM